MKKRLWSLAVCLTVATSLFAYNPPFGGEEIFRLANPELLSGAASASGGPLLTIVPGSIAFNPAVTAFEQRNVLDLSYTAMFDTTFDANKATLDASGIQRTISAYGQAFQIGAIIPTKWTVISAVLQGTFSDFYNMDLGNSLVFRAGASKGVMERVTIGMNLYTGFYMGNTSDFTIGVDLGMLYAFDDIAFLKSPRLGISLLNLGKPVGSTYIDAYGLDGTTTNVAYPSILTPRVSFASTLFNVQGFKGGFSADLSFPFFQNMVFDIAFAATVMDMFQISVSWETNIRELVAGGANALKWPSVGLIAKFAVNSSGISKANADWAQSEIIPSAAWQGLGGGVHAISAGARMDLGMPDTTPPEIILWDEE